MMAAAVLGATLVPAFAADPAGTWLTEEGKAVIRVADCGGALCGTIVSLKEPNDPQTGKPKSTRIMSTPPSAVGQLSACKSWSEQSRMDPTNGRAKSTIRRWQDLRGNIALAGPEHNQGPGLHHGGVICKTNTWTRSQ
jgi:uncharacterized protein (DUF2147 family)